MLIYMPKTNFINRFFLEILCFNECCNLIGCHNSRARILPDVALLVISTTILVSISDYFQEKLMTKFFKESNKPYLGAILGPFYPNLSKNEFSWKKGLSQFLHIPIIYHCTYN